MCFDITLILSYLNCILTALTLQIWHPSKSINYGASSQVLGGQHIGQIWAIRHREVWGSRYPDLQCQICWIGYSICLHELTLSKTEPANIFTGCYSSGIKEHLFRSKCCGRQSEVYGREQLCLHSLRILGCWVPLVLRIGGWLCILAATTLVVWQVPES